MMACALFSFPHYFSVTLLFFSIVLFWNVSCNFFSPCLAQELDMSRTALMIVRVQNDFMKNGLAEVPRANSIIPVINSLIEKYPFKKIFVAQDWHSQKHVSFAINHEGRRAPIQIGYGPTIEHLWPVHCLQGTKGAQLPSDLTNLDFFTCIRMGIDDDDVSMSPLKTWSAYSSDLFSNLAVLFDLKLYGIETVVVVGINVEETVEDLALRCLNAIVINDACVFPTIDNREEVERRLKYYRAYMLNSTDFPLFTFKKEETPLATTAEKEEE